MCAESGGAWHFTSCPACQCNGHSNCSLASAVCDQPCQHNTQVPHLYLLQSCGSGMIFSDPASAMVTPTAPSPVLCATSPASTIHRYTHTVLACSQGVTKRCRLFWLTHSALAYESKCGGWGGGEVLGSQPMSTAVHITCHGAQINFGGLPPYLTYACSVVDPE